MVFERLGQLLGGSHNVILFLLPGLAGLIVSAMISTHYLDSMPRWSVVAENRVVPREIHGIVVYQTEEEVVIQSTVAGVTQENIDISVAQDRISIRGQRLNPEPVHPVDYYHRDLYWGPFSREIILPIDIDVEKARAVIKNGLLTIRLPKLI